MTNSNLKTFDNFYSNLTSLILYRLRIIAKIFLHSWYNIHRFHYIGGTGVTAFLALFDRSIGSDTRGAINAAHLLCLRFFYLLYMFFLLIFWEDAISLNILNNIGNYLGTQLRTGMEKNRKNIKTTKRVC